MKGSETCDHDVILNGVCYFCEQEITEVAKTATSRLVSIRKRANPPKDPDE